MRSFKLSSRCMLFEASVAEPLIFHSIINMASPNPLAGTGYASEHANFLCSRYMGAAVAGDTYPLPCASSRTREWRSAAILKRFVITAWWPPTMSALEAYAAAGFNVLLGGNIASGCQANGTMPSPGSATDAFECVASQLEKIDGLGLKFIYSNEVYKGMTSDQPANLLYGGSDSFGGVSDSGNFTYRSNPTTREVAWVVAELQKRNLSHIVEGFQLHDDVTTLLASTSSSAAYLRDHAPHIVPLASIGAMGATTQVCDCCLVARGCTGQGVRPGQGTRLP